MPEVRVLSPRPESPPGLLQVLLLAAVLVIPAIPARLWAQTAVEDARAALEAGRGQRAVELLRAEVASAPTADAYLYLGIALARVGEAERAQETLSAASLRYPTDSRFHAELAGLHLANREVDLAVQALERAIEVDSANAYASDLLASIRLSEGDIRGALEVWNAVGEPEIDRVSQNFSPGLLDRAIGRALAFAPGDILRNGDWKTTEARLFASRLYTNVSLDLEPSSRGERFNAIVQTSAKGNTRNDILFDLIRGLPVETAYFDFWDIGHSGMSWRSAYRWDKDRRRLSGRLLIPLPLPGLPLVELKDVWRWERWNLERPIRPVFLSDAQFDYKVNAIEVGIEVTPHYRVEVHGGLEYRNRDVTGSLPGLGMDALNSATISAGTIIRTADGRYQNQLRGDLFAARRSILGDYDFEGGTAGILNRLEIDRESQTYLNLALSGGTVRGTPPIDHYFILGLGDVTPHVLRGHVASNAGRYGQSPMGTDFVLVNADLERKIATVPLFNTLSLPYVHIRLMGFFDTGKTFDRQRVFSQDTWYRDTGFGVRFVTPTDTFTLLYGRDLVGHENSFYAYVEPKIW
jgi:tetratricopeptide (TPR) repeat protein